MAEDKKPANPHTKKFDEARKKADAIEKKLKELERKKGKK